MFWFPRCGGSARRRAHGARVGSASRLPSLLTARLSGAKLPPFAALTVVKQVAPSQCLKRASTRAWAASLRSRPRTNRPSSGRATSESGAFHRRGAHRSRCKRPAVRVAAGRFV